MNILIIGSGAREHALAWKLAQSTRVRQVFTAPGNGGTSIIGTNLQLDPLDFHAVASSVRTHKIELVVVGPEDPLANGIADDLQARGIPTFGVSRKAAELESSKAFAKMIMQEHNIPTADSRRFDVYEEARRYVEDQNAPPVIKADGLAAGKGVTVANTTEEALTALKDAMVDGVFGQAGKTVIIEERMTGTEASILAFTDGTSILPAIPACDYKRVYDKELGPNTGGMGSYTPSEFLDKHALDLITATILEPTIRAMVQNDRPYKGILYAGLMLSDGYPPRVVEFNCRLGDPETQVILPQLQSDLLDIIESTLNGKLSSCPIEWAPGASVGVVMTSGGYPGSYLVGHPITGLNNIDNRTNIFHAGTKVEGGQFFTNGGRVLTVVARGNDMAEARDQVYENVEKLHFEGAHYRRDIGLRAVY